MKEFTIDEIKSVLESFHTKSFYYKHMLQKYNPDMWDFIYSKTNFLVENASFPERMYCIENNVTEPVLCLHCHEKRVEFNGKENRYRDFCSLKCMLNDEKTKNKIKQTMISRYGVDHASKSKEIREKTRKTNIERYGVDCTFKSPEFREKAIITKQKKYGISNSVVYEKSKQTCLRKYGVEYSFQSENNRKKSEATCLKKYGVKHISLSKDVRKKIINSVLKKYGASSVLENPEIYKKSQEIRRLNRYKKLKDDKGVELLTPIEDFKGKGKIEVLKWKCRQCGNTFESKIDHNFYKTKRIYARCEKCYPKKKAISEEEKSLGNFIKENYSGFILTNDRKILDPYELDIVLPNKKLAIEFDGNFWHSEDGGKDQHYHLMKTKGCEEQGYHLIHIFESDWTDKNKQVKTFLKSCIFEDNNFQESNFTVKNISFEIAKKFSKQFIVCNLLKKSHQYFGLVDKENRLISAIGISTKKNIVSIENFVWAYSRNKCFSVFLSWLKISFPNMVLQMKTNRMYFEESFLPLFGFAKTMEMEPLAINVKKKLFVYDCGKSVFQLNP